MPLGFFGEVLYSRCRTDPLMRDQAIVEANPGGGGFHNAEIESCRSKDMAKSI